MNKKGFTLIELLAVITIVGVLIMASTPAVSLVVDNVRKNTYLNVARNYIRAGKTKINGNDFDISWDTDTTYYIHINNFEMEKGEGQSPYAEFEDAYVVVIYTGEGKNLFYYYWASKDKAGYRMDVTREDLMNRKSIYHNSNRPLNNRAPVGVRNKIVIIDKNGSMSNASQVLEITAEEADRCYSYEFIESNKTVKLTYYNKNCGSEVRIPGIIDGYTVTEIYSYTFYNMGLTGVVIPGSVKKIGSNAFSNNKLTSVVLPHGLETIDSEAFMNNKLPSVYLPDGLKTIGSRSFKKNEITSYDIPNSVTSLGSCAFCDNPIPNPSFLYAKNNDGSTNYAVIRGYIGDLSEFENKRFLIPGNVNGVPLTTIESSAFYRMGLSDWEVVIPDTVTTIKSSALSMNGLAKVNLPSNLQTIGDSAFYSNHISQLSIPASVTSIGSLAFNDNRVTGGDDLWIYERTSSGINYSKIIGYSGANRSNITIPPSKNGKNLTTIGGSALRYLSLTGGVTIPSTVNSIGTLAFALNKLDWVDNGDGDKTGPFVYSRNSDGSINKASLLSYAGYSKSHVDIPSSVKTIQSHAFYYTYTKSVTIPEGVTTIGNNAFELCKLEGTVVIPSTVTSIGQNAFKKQITWTSMNGSLNKIVNKTGRSFNWQSITGGPEAATFETGIVKNWYGNIEVTKN